MIGMWKMLRILNDVCVCLHLSPQPDEVKHKARRLRTRHSIYVCHTIPSKGLEFQ